jgi:hypothetical protein
VAEAKSDAAQARQDLKADRKADNQKVNQWGYTAKEWRTKTQAERQKIIRGQKNSGRAPNTKVYPGGRTWKEWKALTPQQRERLAASESTGTTGKDKYGNTVAGRRAANDDFQSARTLAKALYEKGDSWQDLYELIALENQSLPPVMARAAAQLIARGKVHGRAAAELRRRGVRMPKARKRGNVVGAGNQGNVGAPGYNNGEKRPN